MKGGLSIFCGLGVLAILMAAAFGVTGLLTLGGFVIAFVGVTLIGYGFDTLCDKD